MSNIIEKYEEKVYQEIIRLKDTDENALRRKLIEDGCLYTFIRLNNNDAFKELFSEFKYENKLKDKDVNNSNYLFEKFINDTCLISDQFDLEDIDGVINAYKKNNMAEYERGFEEFKDQYKELNSFVSNLNDKPKSKLKNK